jgi:acyl-CoA synthetase (AMP-forming)/AMP-acid ligase II
VFWVPHFHDLCLITGIVGALWGNGHLYLISPLAFIRDPAIWFDVMSRVKATHTAAPNLAFELAVRKTTPEQRQKWDLSSLKILLTAAEPIRESTVRTFFDAFFCTGLREDAFCPAYGLAEHSAALSVRGREVVRVDRSTLECDGAVRLAKEDADASGTTVIFGCGRPMPGVTVKVVDPETHTPLGEGRVGEIWVNSPSVARGYVELTEATKGTFGAHLAGEADGTAYLRTGDLGFLFRGELFFSGRHQDLIRLGVRSLYPHDVEYAVRDAHPMVRPGCVIACSFDDDGAPGLAVFAEVRADRLAPQLANDIVRAIRQDILAQHGEVCALVWLGRPGSIPKTTSGKLRRSRCRELVQGDCAAIPGTLHVASIGADGPKIRLRRTVEAAAKVCAQ